MDQVQVRVTGGETVWFDAALAPGFEPGHFDPAHLRRAGLLTGSAAGRNPVWFFALDGREMALRHYWRGGLWGRVVRDRFLRTAVAQSRAMREFALLGRMAALGLPVPRPVAARHAGRGLTYRADLVTERIADTVTLADRLGQRALAPALWRRIGATIARFHAAGVHHPDLNARNILLAGDGAVWLIDFDKAAVRAAGGWRAATLARLRRSLDKLQAQGQATHFDEGGWHALTEGYGAGPD